jgi:hypothetical protein
MNRGVAALVLFGSLALSSSHASGEGCTPVVYAFRHAEDTRPIAPEPPDPQPPVTDLPLPIFSLTPTGKAHAALYPKMIREFGTANNFCLVKRVYSTTKAPKQSTAQDPCFPNCASATNAFDTAMPSATDFMSSTTPPTATPPLTAVGKYQLYEFLGNSNGGAPSEANTNYSTVEAAALRAELLATANRSESSAIFWTSEGLHVLAGAIIGTKSAVPPKTDAYSPPRNVVYLFTANDGPPNIKSFSDTAASRPPSFADPLYVQCFNHIESEAGKYSAPTFLPNADFKLPSNYACGFGDIQSNLGGKPPKTCVTCAFGKPTWGTCQKATTCGTIPNDQNTLTDGKICAIASLVGDRTNTLYGQCN